MKKIMIPAIIAVMTGAAGIISAGEIENLSAGAEKAFGQIGFYGDARTFLQPAPAPGIPAALADVSEYKKLVAAFEKGTVPAKKDFTGWHAGRFLDKDFPDYPGSLLMAGVEASTVCENGGVYKIVPMTFDASPDFYETLSADIVGGVAIFIDEKKGDWTAPVFGPAEVTFEMIMPSYNKGFSRYAVRKAADNRILVKHTWKDVWGVGPDTEGVFYAYFTKDVTPK